MARLRQHAVALALVCLLCGAAILPVTAMAASADGRDHDPADRPLIAANQEDGQENNTSTQHENPSEAGEDGDLEGVNDWLTNRLADQLGESTIQLSQGEYDAARDVVGDDYSDRLGQLVDVEGETEERNDDDGDDDNDSAAFERAQENQQEFVSSVQEYRETRERYQEAKQNGNESGARRLARRLDSIAQSVNSSGSGLLTDYHLISNGTDRDLSEQSRTVANTTDNITGLQREIREAEFVETTITVEPREAEISFSDPLAVTGRLTTANRSALENESVELQLGEQRRRVTTNETGQFSVTLRPTVQPLDTQNATLRFVPSDASVYLGTEETVSVEIEQVSPAVLIDEAPSAVAFNESITVTGSVSFDDVPVVAVPVEIRIDGVRLGQVRTDEDGEFALTTRLPAAIRTGDQQINASLPFQGRALSSTGTEQAVVVRETNTSVTLSASQNGTERINATGRLTADDGTPIADQRVELRVNGSVVETVRTDENGRYEANLTVPSTVLGDDGSGRVRIAAVYSTDRTNLADARAMTVLTVTQPSEQSQLVSPDLRRYLPIAAVIAAAAIVGGLLWRRRRRRASSAAPVTDESETESEPAAATEEADSRSELSFDGARAALDAGRTDEAVELMYGDVRRRLAARFDVPAGRTHWEFYRECEGAVLDEDTIDVLERLTEAYEGAAYAPGDFSEPEVAALLDTVETTDIPRSR
jgi:hypothetical protein